LRFFRASSELGGAKSAETTPRGAQAADSKQLEDVEDLTEPEAEAPARPDAEPEGYAGSAEQRLEDALGGPDVYSIGSLEDGLCLCPGKDFSFAVQLYDRFMARQAEEKERAKRQEAREKEREKRGEKRKAEGKPDTPAEPKKPKTRVEAVGVIIVPSAMTSLITILNAADLLERSTFATPQEKRKQGAKKELAVKISRTMPDGSIQTFKVVDNPQRLSESDWRRVIAVFAQGAAWQFKGWKVSQPVEIFNKFLGVHLKYDDADTPAEVKRWNVNILSVNKYKRHLDQTTAVQFWRLVDEWLARKKAERKAEKAKKAEKAAAAKKK